MGSRCFGWLEWRLWWFVKGGLWVCDSVFVERVDSVFIEGGRGPSINGHCFLYHKCNLLPSLKQFVNISNIMFHVNSYFFFPFGVVTIICCKFKWAQVHKIQYNQKKNTHYERQRWFLFLLGWELRTLPNLQRLSQPPFMDIYSSKDVLEWGLILNPAVKLFPWPFKPSMWAWRIQLSPCRGRRLH